MNIYEKLLTAKIKLVEMGLQKSGHNKYSNIQYYELSDIMIPILKVCQELKLSTSVSFDNEKASLTIVDCEKPENSIVIQSPMREANLKGCHAIQNLGAVETYQRRYLYLTAFDIVENDILDKTLNKDNHVNNQIDNATDKLNNAMDESVQKDIAKFVDYFGNKQLEATDLDDFNKVKSGNVNRQELNALIQKFKTKYSS